MSEVLYKDILSDGSNFEISLSKLVGKKIKDIRGILTMPFDNVVVFQLTKIAFEDDSFLGCEAEHDCPYLVNYPRYIQPNFDVGTLERLYDEAEEG